MKIVFIINDAPYGTEKAYNALRLANQLLKDNPKGDVNIFLLADAVLCGMDDQKTPDGYYNLSRMIKMFLTMGGSMKACGTCMDSRGITELLLQSGVEKSNMKELSLWITQADKILTY